jgi:HEPN domain-containing protein
MDNKDELVQNWLIKAQHDLLAAKKLSIEPEIYADIAIYHCQQSAEKAVRNTNPLRYRVPIPKRCDGTKPRRIRGCTN